MSDYGSCEILMTGNEMEKYVLDDQQILVLVFDVAYVISEVTKCLIKCSGTIHRTSSRTPDVARKVWDDTQWDRWKSPRLQLCYFSI